MSSTNRELLQSALLGSQQRKPEYGGLAPSLREISEALTQKRAHSQEGVFALTTASYYAYQRAGLSPAMTEAKERHIAPTEQRTSSNDSKLAYLLRLLAQKGENPLLLYLYRQIEQKGELVPPHCLPLLIRRAHKDKAELEQLSTIWGERGKWLMQLMGMNSKPEEETPDWATASHEERVQLFAKERKHNPQQALEILQADWKGEKANKRKDFLTAMRATLSLSDEAFLQEVHLKDKSTEVRKLALDLLWLIPEGKLLSQAKALIQQHHQKHWLTGWGWKEISHSDDLASIGIEALSPIKGESDSMYILRQLCERMPLKFWQEHYGLSEEKTAERLINKPPLPHYDLYKAIITHQDKSWAGLSSLGKAIKTEHIDAILSLLSQEERERLPHIYPSTHYLDIPIGSSWGERFALGWLKQLSQTTYPSYSQSELAQVALCLPRSLAESNVFELLINEQTHYSTEKCLRSIAKHCATIKYINELLHL